MQKSDVLIYIYFIYIYFIYIYICFPLNKHTTLLQEIDVHGGNQRGAHLNPWS